MWIRSASTAPFLFTYLERAELTTFKAFEYSCKNPWIYFLFKIVRQILGARIVSSCHIAVCILSPMKAIRILRLILSWNSIRWLKVSWSNVFSAAWGSSLRTSNLPSKAGKCRVMWIRFLSLAPGVFRMLFKSGFGGGSFSSQENNFQMEAQYVTTPNIMTCHCLIGRSGRNEIELKNSTAW